MLVYLISDNYGFVFFLFSSINFSNLSADSVTNLFEQTNSGPEAFFLRSARWCGRFEQRRLGGLTQTPFPRIEGFHSTMRSDRAKTDIDLSL